MRCVDLDRVVAMLKEKMDSRYSWKGTAKWFCIYLAKGQDGKRKDKYERQIPHLNFVELGRFWPQKKKKHTGEH